MKKIFLNLVVVGIFASVFLALMPAHSVMAAPLTYTPLEPIGASGNTTGAVNLAAYLNSLFKILFSLGGLLAVVMLVVGGIQYMMSTVPGIKATGLARARAALFGLLILAGSYLILYTINPNLIKLNLFVNNTPLYVAPAQTNQSGQTSGNTIPGSVCTSSSGSGGFKTYFSNTNSPCVTQINSILSSLGESVNTKSRGSSVLVFKSTQAVTDFRSELDIFSNDCFQDGGHSKSIGNTTNNEPVYVCIK
jgi:hypothetical protein